MQAAPVFGKRSAAPPRATPFAAATAPSTPAATDHAAFFAAVRAETERDDRPRGVPRSTVAAMIAGAVVGCGLAGLDVMRIGASLQDVGGGLLATETTSRLVPVVLALGLYKGARTAAIVLFVAHAGLRQAGLVSHLAYALAGGAVALAFSALAIVARQAGLPAGLFASHGIVLDAVAGVAAGFLYRVFAGTTREALKAA